MIEQNYITVRDGQTFGGLFTSEFLEFNCSYGLPSQGASNRFSVKTRLTSQRIPVGSFIQLNGSNWCGQVLQMDIDFKNKTILYTGDSLYAWTNHFIPVRTEETISNLSIKRIDVEEGVTNVADKLDAIIDKYDGQWTTQETFSRLNELCELANFPLVLSTRNTTYGSIDNPYDSGTIAKYSDYQFYDFGLYVHIWYGSDGNIYDSWTGQDGDQASVGDVLPSGVTALITVFALGSDIILNSQKGLLESFEEFLAPKSCVDFEVTDKANLVVINRFFDEGANLIPLDSLQAPVYYHEKMIPNMVPVEADETIVALKTNGDISDGIPAPNDADFDELQGAANLYKGGKIYFKYIEAEDTLDAKNKYSDFVAEQRLTYDHSLDISDSDEPEYIIGQTYNLYSGETGIENEADLYEKIITATPSGHKITYNFRRAAYLGANV